MASGQRRPKESFKKYRARLKKEDAEIKIARHGKLLWNSSILGTYSWKEHGDLQETYSWKDLIPWKMRDKSTLILFWCSTQIV